MILTFLSGFICLLFAFIIWKDRAPRGFARFCDSASAGVMATLAGILLGSAAHADEFQTIEWEPPTHCENGDAIGTTAACPDLEEYRFTCSFDPGPPYDDLTWFIDAPAVVDDRLYPPGDYYCRLAVSNAHGFSNWSSPEFFFRVSADPSVPNPPTVTTQSDGGL